MIANAPIVRPGQMQPFRPPGPRANSSFRRRGLRRLRGRAGPPLRAVRELIQAKLDQGLSAQRIWQDLVAEHGFAGSYDSVKRFVRRLAARTPLPFRRMECAPGEEAQVDFGTGAPDHQRRTASGARPTSFASCLSHSRKAYSEATFTQTTEDFLRCLENAFAHFGGVPKTLVIDNLKAAVAHPDWFDPELTPKVQSFCRHYGTVILPTQALHAAAQGEDRVGREVRQEQRPEGRGRSPAWQKQNRFLAEWERDGRRHADPRHDQAAGGQVFEKSNAQRCCRCRGTLPLLPRSAAQGQPRRARGGGQGVLLGAAGVSGTRRLGALGRAAGADLQSPLRADRACTCGTSRAGSAPTPQHIAREKISGLERGAAYLLEQGPADRPAHAAVGRRRCCTRAASKARACCKGSVS